jgi:hypothetical protein
MDQWVRLGMTITIIALISVGLHRFSDGAKAVEPGVASITYQR